MTPIDEFDAERGRSIAALRDADALQQQGMDLLTASAPLRYTYNFDWMGIPIIQLPQDLVAIQELLWRVRPEVVVETGIAHGGGLVFYASMLELLGGDGKVIGVDIDIRAHNRARLDQHPMRKRIEMIQGSSIDPAVVAEVSRFAEGKRTMVMLDSNHTHEHVLEELRLYSPLVEKDSYLIVLDTIIEDQPEELFPNRPWSRTNNPKTAIREFLKENDRFVIDNDVDGKLLLTVARDGFLKCVK